MADLSASAKGMYALSGDVSLDDVARLSVFPAGDQSPEVTLDLGGVVSADSAVAALLLSWKRQLLANDQSLKIVRPPESVTLLLDLYDLEPVLGH